MTAQRVTAMAFIVVLASSVGFSQVKTNVPDVVRTLSFETARR